MNKRFTDQMEKLISTWTILMPYLLKEQSIKRNLKLIRKHRVTEVGGSNTGVCAPKLWRRVWELDWNVDIEFL